MQQITQRNKINKKKIVAKDVSKGLTQLWNTYSILIIVVEVMS